MKKNENDELTFKTQTLRTVTFECCGATMDAAHSDLVDGKPSDPPTYTCPFGCTAPRQAATALEAPANLAAGGLGLKFEQRDTFQHAARFRNLGLTAYGETKHEAFLHLSGLLMKFCVTHGAAGTLERVLEAALSAEEAVEPGYSAPDCARIEGQRCPRTRSESGDRMLSECTNKGVCQGGGGTDLRRLAKPLAQDAVVALPEYNHFTGAPMNAAAAALAGAVERCDAAILGGKCVLKAGHRDAPWGDDENMHKLAPTTACQHKNTTHIDGTEFKCDDCPAVGNPDSGMWSTTTAGEPVCEHEWGEIEMKFIPADNETYDIRRCQKCPVAQRRSTWLKVFLQPTESETSDD